MTRYAISLGSNVGDRLDHLRRACIAIAEHVDTWQISRLYETAPVGGPAQDPFLNAIVVVETGLEPTQLLDVLHEIENDHERARELRWGPRTLDLDIVTCDEGSVVTERLVIPHTHARRREFVLRPLNDVWPEANVGDRLTAREALALVDSQDVYPLVGNWVDPPAWRGPALVAGQFVIILLAALAMAIEGDLPSLLSFGGIIGVVLMVSGALLVMVASNRLGRGLSPFPEPNAGGELVEDGPYSHARHPIYGGVILFMTGIAVFFGSVLAFVLALVLAPYLWFKSSYEELQLRIRYPAYGEYRRKVRARLIPFIL